MMAVNKGFVITEGDREYKDNSMCYSKIGNKVHSFDESIELAGSGWYGASLLAALSLATMAMGMDLFGFSVVVAGAACDLHLDLAQTSLLLAMPFIGPIVMAYPWGYVCDVYGRKRSLLISLWGSFMVSSISAFCSHWTLIALLKFLSTSLSSCAQSATYSLLGESCPKRVRDGYMLIMTSMLDFMLAVYIAIAYGILNLDFSINLVLLTFRPWRLLALVLATFLGLAAGTLHFFYESPKFLLSAGREDETMEVLRGIWTRNGGRYEDYPVKKVYLNEEGNYSYKGYGLLKSLWFQVVPLFRPPLLWRSLLLFLLTAVAFGTSNPSFVWFPLLAQKFFEGINISGDQEAGLCYLITSSYNSDTLNDKCSSGIELNVVLSSLMQGLVFVAILFGLAKLTSRKRAVMIIVLLTSGLCGFGAMLVPHNLLSFMLFFGQMACELVVGVIYSYFVDLYPTSHRGMAACLGTMVARVSSLAGTSLFGAFMMTQCSYTFYICSAITICGAFASLLLPPDRITRHRDF